MALSKRHRYTSRREKLAKNSRNLRVVVIFVFIALGFYVYFNRWSIYDYLKTYFY
ncbi:MAG: hypothetical protein AAFP19_08400 [Bacteroidota bacterium]